MFNYIIRRTLYMIPIIIGVTMLTFVLFNVFGGNPALQAAGKHASAAEIEILKHEMGLDLPIYQQYFFYLKQIVTFDFGRSWSTKQEISTMIISGLGPSLSLTVPAFVISVILSICLALLVSQFRGSKFDKTVMILCLAALSTSSLVYILFMQYFFGYKLGWFPISGWDESWIGRWSYLSLPIFIFVVISLGGDILLYRTVFIEEIYQDYVRTARAKGLGNGKILFKHVLKNALIPIITVVVLQMPFLILGSLLVENFFGIPGLGSITVQAINNSDFPVIKATTFIGAILYMVFQLLSDVLYAVVDPKVQLS
jgi:peptide/nickel transport system permease protein